MDLQVYKTDLDIDDVQHRKRSTSISLAEFLVLKSALVLLLMFLSFKRDSLLQNTSRNERFHSISKITQFMSS